MKQAGFSLIELMLTIAIIGLLASIALPNFQLLQERVHQIEAKSDLSGVYTAEQSFYAEFSSYTTEFDQLALNFSGSMMYELTFNGFDPYTGRQRLKFRQPLSQIAPLAKKVWRSSNF